MLAGTGIRRKGEPSRNPGDRRESVKGRDIRCELYKLSRGKFEGVNTQTNIRRLIITAQECSIIITELGLHAREKGFRKHQLFWLENFRSIALKK